MCFVRNGACSLRDWFSDDLVFDVFFNKLYRGKWRMYGWRRSYTAFFLIACELSLCLFGLVERPSIHDNEVAYLLFILLETALPYSLRIPCLPQLFIGFPLFRKALANYYTETGGNNNNYYLFAYSCFRASFLTKLQTSPGHSCGILQTIFCWSLLR